MTNGSFHYPEPEFTYEKIPEDFGDTLVETLEEFKQDAERYFEENKQLYRQEETGMFNFKRRALIRYQGNELMEDLERTNDLIRQARDYERKISTDDGFAMPEKERSNVDRIENSNHEEIKFLNDYRKAETIYQEIHETFTRDIGEKTFIEFNQDFNTGIQEKAKEIELEPPRIRGYR